MNEDRMAARLEASIGYRFRKADLLEEALRHASMLGEDADANSYQRLEYLGDAVINLCVAELTFHRFPEAGEGDLSKARSAVINNRNLFRVGHAIGIAESVRTDPSVRGKGGGVTPKMIADTVEALAGAIFLDGGMDEARRFVGTHFWQERLVDRLVAQYDAKSRLQERCQGDGTPLPRYRMIEEKGPPHRKTFTVEVTDQEGRSARGIGNTKKAAEMEAAANLLAAFEEEERE